MTGPEPTPEAARLDELAAVTTRYATYSRTAFGFATALTGGWFLAALAIASWRSRPAGELVMHAGPLVWMYLLVRARAYYQRRGEVVQQEIPNRSLEPTIRRWFLAFIYGGALIGIFSRFESSSEVHLLVIADVAIFVALPMVALSVTRGINDTALTMASCHLGVTWTRGAFPAWGIAAFAAWLIAAGLVQHVRYRRLERRLSALNAGTP